MKLNVGQSDLCYLEPDDLERVLTGIKAFGFEQVRFEVPFHRVCWTKGKWDWSLVERVAKALHRHNLKALPVLGAHMPPTWKPTADVYAQFVTGSLVALKDLWIEEVELWNEPNLMIFWLKADPVTFYGWAKAGYDAVKRTNPDIQVILGGLAAADTQYTGWFKFLQRILGGNKSPLDFISAMMLQAKGKKFYDKVGYHPYSLEPDFEEVLPESDVFGISAGKVLEVFVGGKDKVVYTEVGFQQFQALWLKAQLALMSLDGAYLYCWRDTGGQRFGLVNMNNVPKEPYYSYVKGLL